MRRVCVEDLRENEILGKSLYDEEGRILVKDGLSLSNTIIKKLSEYGIPSIYISDEISAGIEIEDVISDETRHKMKKSIKDTMEKLYSSGKTSFDDVVKSTGLITDEIIVNRSKPVSITDIRSKDDTIYSHSINVCALATLTAIQMGFNQIRVKDISVGALLHDIGKIQILKDNNLKINEIRKLKPEDLKNHPRLGYELLGKDFTFSTISKIATFLHHENCDGSGYPLGLKKDDIHESARIVAICNKFDNLVSGNFENQKIPIYQAVQYLKNSTDIFDQEIVNVFLKNITLYPNGTIVELNNGQKAIVVKQNKGFTASPLIRIIFDVNMNLIPNPKEVDLSKDQSLSIVGTI